MTGGRPTPGDSPDRVRYPRLALWLALAAGLIEGGVRMVQYFGEHRVILMPLDIVWMAPVVDLLWLLPPLALLLLLDRRRAARPAPRVGVALLATFAAIPVMWLIPGMHKGAGVVLALGIAIQLSRLLAPARIEAIVSRSLLWLLGLVLLQTAAVVGGRALHQRQMIAARPPVHGKPPNVLLLVWDTARDPSLSLDGYARPTTPGLQHLAAEGAEFAHAMSAASWTLPSHATLFTGQWPYVVYRGQDRAIRSPTPPLAAVLHRAGYATAGFTGNVGYTDRQHGLARGFEHYEDYPRSLATAIAHARVSEVLLSEDWVRGLIGYPDQVGRKRAEDVNRSFLHWLDRRDRSRPFFVFLNYFDAHFPYRPPAAERRRFVRPTTVPYHMWFRRRPGGTPARMRWMNDLYDACIAHLDRATADLVRELARRGIEDNTIIVVTADHGEQFGEHGLVGHGNSLYPELLHVPLVIRYPAGIAAGTRVQDPVSLRDVPRTILALTGVSSAAPVPGRSLARYWAGPPPQHSLILAELAQRVSRHLGPHAILNGDLEYIREARASQPGMLFDLVRDPAAAHDLRDAPGYEETTAALRSRSDSLIGAYDRWYRDGGLEHLAAGVSR